MFPLFCETLYKYADVGILIEVNKLVRGHGAGEKRLQGKRVEGMRRERGQGGKLRRPKVPNPTLSNYKHSRTHIIVSSILKTLEPDRGWYKPV